MGLQEHNDVIGIAMPYIAMMVMRIHVTTRALVVRKNLRNWQRAEIFVTARPIL